MSRYDLSGRVWFQKRKKRRADFSYKSLREKRNAAATVAQSLADGFMPFSATTLPDTPEKRTSAPATGENEPVFDAKPGQP